MYMMKHKGTAICMNRQVDRTRLTPRDLVDRLLQYEMELGLPSSKLFARQIGVTPDAITPQMLSNWKAGDDISLGSLLLLKPAVRARILLERPAEEELVHEGMLLGLAAARQALEKEEQRLRDKAPNPTTESARGAARARRQLAAALEEEQTAQAGRKPPARKKRRG